MNYDISSLLESWDYQPGQLAVRRFTGKDGRDKVQMRLDLGILQMNADGRPDGKRPMGHDSWYDFLVAKLEAHKAEHGGEDEEFLLKAQDVARLQQEAIQFHHRYICFFQLNDYANVLRDAERNVQVFDFVDEHAETEDLSWSLQQFRPQLLMMLTRAEGTMAIDEEDWDQVKEVIEEGIAALKEFYTEFERPDLMENSGEIMSLERWLEEIETDAKQESPDGKTKRPGKKLTELELLEMDLKEAILREDYERAAEVRDQLNRLKEP